ncbi:helix-turn-helix domain-containing protein [Lysinibacillus sp. 1 U-2021]|uniref:helix-turn-helix domain-containing protein n=1 Tax=Lysinibacillus sp. 1 U-2021 TaxID=3039426 RepID=UPI0024800795|nr:helix-turn-helix domain-containing protein [Lysinibacillus sp. 1 U-2021]WGT39143.1 helix-turn-helix domain-containing protein [Lysinibacillus sp. 1 U-2021]
MDIYSLDDVKNLLGFKSATSVRNLIDKGLFKTAQKINGKWTISKADLEEFLEHSKNNEFVTFSEAGKILGKNPRTLLDWHRKGEIFPNAQKTDRLWKIPMKDVKEFKNVLDTYSNDKYYTRKDISELLGIQTVTATKLINSGVISSNIFKINGEYNVPKADFDLFLKEQRKYNEDYVYLKDAATKINTSFAAVSQRIRKYFPNAIKDIWGKWKVPPSDIHNYLSKTNIYNKNVALKELLIFVNDQYESFEHKETLKLYKAFLKIQFNKMHGSLVYIRDRENTYKKLFIHLTENLTDEIYLLHVNDIEQLLIKAKVKSLKLLLPRFLNYCYAIKDISSPEKIVIDLSNKNQNNQIYSPVIFNQIYNYSKDVSKHKLNAIENQSYANMWAYTILLLTDFIRGADLIFKMPNINLDFMKSGNFKYITQNNLILKESHLIINQLYTHFRNKRANKTGELLTFIVSPDLVVPLAHALVISELHRQKNNQVYLLNTFISDSMYQHVYTSGNQSHREFFTNASLPTDFKFHSQKMNRSVGTYLFFSIVEEDADNADLALTLTQGSRSHKDSNSTAIYIQLTNKDGYINRVSINLFRRGYFGWLYNYLILTAIQHQEIQHTIEERTAAIEELRSKYSLNQTEDLAQMYLDVISNGDIDSYFESRSEIIEINSENLSDIYSKFNSIIEKIKKYSIDDIRNTLLKLAKGELPSKNEFGQCLIYPKCEYPLAKNCFKCEYFIPQYLVLIELKQEIDKVIDLINKTNNYFLLKKHSHFLKYYLFLWKEARLAYGEEIANAYLPKEHIKSMIENIAHKILLKND